MLARLKGKGGTLREHARLTFRGTHPHVLQGGSAPACHHCLKTGVMKPAHFCFEAVLTCPSNMIFRHFIIFYIMNLVDNIQA